MPPIAAGRSPFRLPVQPYPLHPRIKRFFLENVNKGFDDHPKSNAWREEVVDRDWRYHSNDILERGRTSFLSTKNGLSPADQVILYCHYYMHQHAASGMHVFLRGLIEHKVQFLHNPVMIDFGCGPMTAAISLAWYNLVANKTGETDKLYLHYIGIDRAPAMLEYCQAIPKPSYLYRATSTFDFVTRSTAHAEVPTLLSKHRAGFRNQRITLLLNFSYVFGAKVLDVERLANFVRALLSLLKPGDFACLVFQNAWANEVNVKWEDFKKRIKNDLTCVSCEQEEISYHDAGAKGRQRNPWSTRLRRELLLNETWMEKLKKA